MIEDYAIQGAVAMFGLFMLVFVLLFALGKLWPRSYEYRKLLADMFVAGKIKQLAKKEDIDLLEELKEFAKFMKFKKIDVEAIDATIERELQEKVANLSSDKEDK